MDIQNRNCFIFQALICRKFQEDGDWELQVPNSNAFVDVNGDCLSDLVVTSCSNASNCEESKRVEIWINTKGSFYKDKDFPIPPGSGQLSFADFGTYCFVSLTCGKMAMAQWMWYFLFVGPGQTAPSRIPSTFCITFKCHYALRFFLQVIAAKVQICAVKIQTISSLQI